MKFPCTFTRWVGAAPSGSKVLGSDILPVDAASNPTKAQASSDNLLSSRVVSINGWPLQRIAFVGRYIGGGTPVAGSVQVFTFEDNLGIWLPLQCSAGASPTYTCGATVATQAGPIFFDAMTLIDLPHAAADLNSVNPGTAQFVAIVGAGTSPPNGQYIFAMGPELTQKSF